MMMWMASLTQQMKIHLQTSALAYDLWCGVKRTLDASDDANECCVLEVAKCGRHLLQTC